MNPQYKKGVLELCVLSLLRRRDRYGYEISEFLAGLDQEPQRRDAACAQRR